MKRIRSFLLFLLCAMILFASPLSVAAVESYIRGDADADGAVTVIDVAMIQRHTAGLSVSPFDERAADVNDDGLDIVDAARIQRYLAGIETPYGIGELVTVKSPSDYDEYELPVM